MSELNNGDDMKNEFLEGTYKSRSIAERHAFDLVDGYLFNYEPYFLFNNGKWELWFDKATFY